MFDLSLAVKLLSRSMEEIFACASSTIFIEVSNGLTKNSTKDKAKLGHMIVHIIPRKPGDKSNNDGLYNELETYPEEYPQRPT